MSMGRRMRRLAREAIPATFKLAASYMGPGLPQPSSEPDLEPEKYVSQMEAEGKRLAEAYECTRCGSEIKDLVDEFTGKLREKLPKYQRRDEIISVAKELGEVEGEYRTRMNDILRRVETEGLVKPGENTAEKLIYGKKHEGEKDAKPQLPQKKR